MTVTLARLATEFLERPGLSQSTRRSYQFVLMPLLVELGRLPVEMVSRQLISEYLQRLEHLSITTHHRHQAIIQLCLIMEWLWVISKVIPLLG